MPTPSQSRSFRAEKAEAGLRLDAAVACRLAHIPGVTRALSRGWVEEGLVRVNGQAAKPSRRLAPGDEIEILLPPPPARPAADPRDMPLDVLFEDDWLLAVNKPAGLLVHPTPGRREDGTLLHGLLWQARQWGEGRRPHLVSRLDRDTSGLLLVAKSPELHAALARAMRARGTAKDYLAVVYGRPELPKGRIDLPILRDPGNPRQMTTSRTEGRPSSTLWERLAAAEREPLAVLRCRLLTGRTHQIRVHLRDSRMPLVGDPVYGAPGWKGIADPGLAALCRDFPRQALHARRLAFAHPVSGAPLEITAPPPPDLAGLLTAAGLVGAIEA